VGHAHDPALGLAALGVEATGFQPDVQEDVLGDFFRESWLFQHEHR